MKRNKKKYEIESASKYLQGDDIMSRLLSSVPGAFFLRRA